jgi:hypothetical protein
MDLENGFRVSEESRGAPQRRRTREAPPLELGADRRVEQDGRRASKAIPKTSTGFHGYLKKLGRM